MDLGSDPVKKYTHKTVVVELMFSVTTVIPGLAAALLLAIGIRAAPAPWNDGTRSAASANQAGSASPAAGAALSSDSDQPRPLPSGPSRAQCRPPVGLARQKANDAR